MKIGIVALSYNPGTAGGVERYFLDLLNGLGQIDNTNRYTVFVQPEAAATLSKLKSNMQIVSLEDTAASKIARKLRLPYLRSKLSLAGKIDSYNCDLVHFPFQVINPLGIKTKKILSFMDMQQEYFPQFFSQQDLDARRSSYKASCDAADHIIAISEHTRSTLIDRYQITPAKVTTVHLGYNKKLYSGKPIALAEPLPEPYFYYPAATWPHKNHQRLLEAFAEFLPKHPQFSLVLSGISKQGSHDVNKAIAKLKLDHKVVRLGYLPYEQLPAVFQHSYGLVFPSLFEGFGIPLLEAMASHCPIVASRTTSIPEIADTAALYFDPLNVQDIAKALAVIAEQPKLRQQLIAKGNQRVKLFSDVKMATETLNVYRKLGSNHV